MSTQNVTMKHENRRGWFVAVLVVSVVLVASVVWYLLSAVPGTAANEVPANTPAIAWADQGIDDYRYTVQVGCFCIVEATRPVVVEVRDGQAVSFTYADDGTAADPALFERYGSMDKIFVIISDAEAQNPVRLDVTYDEATGVPQSIAIDISEQMADEELYLEITGFEALAD